MLHLLKNENIGIFIKKDNFDSYFSKTVLNILECDENEVEKKLFEIKEINQFLDSEYTELFFDITLRINEKNKKLKFILHKYEDILLIIILDNTEMINSFLISETIFELIKLIYINNEEELFYKVKNVLLKNKEFVAVFIVIKEDNILKPVIWGNKFEKKLDYIENLKIPLDNKSSVLNTPVIKAVTEGKIVINNNSKINEDILFFKDEILKRDYLSSVGIPIFKHKKPYGAICIYSKDINFFDKFKEELEEISNIISYILDVIEDNKFKDIIKKAIEVSFEWLILTDKNGEILYINEVVEKKIGFSKEEIIGKNIKIFFKDQNTYNIIKLKLKNDKIYKGLIKIQIENNEILLIGKVINFNNHVIYILDDIIYMLDEIFGT